MNFWLKQIAEESAKEELWLRCSHRKSLFLDGFQLVTVEIAKPKVYCLDDQKTTTCFKSEDRKEFSWLTPSRNIRVEEDGTSWVSIHQIDELDTQRRLVQLSHSCFHVIVNKKNIKL